MTPASPPAGLFLGVVTRTQDAQRESHVGLFVAYPLGAKVRYTEHVNLGTFSGPTCHAAAHEAAQMIVEQCTVGRGPLCRADGPAPQIVRRWHDLTDVEVITSDIPQTLADHVTAFEHYRAFVGAVEDCRTAFQAAA